MTTMPYQTQEEAAGIIAEYQTKGYILSEVRDHLDGSSLIFLDPDESAPEVPASAVDPIEDLKAQVADLKAQLEEVKANVDKHDADLMVLTESVKAESVKTEAVEAVKG